MQPPRHQDQRQNKSKTCGLHFFVGEAAEAYIGSRIGYHKFCVAQSHKRDKHSNARRSRVLQAIGHAVDDLLANPRHGEHEEENT